MELAPPLAPPHEVEATIASALGSITSAVRAREQEHESRASALATELQGQIDRAASLQSALHASAAALEEAQRGLETEASLRASTAENARRLREELEREFWVVAAQLHSKHMCVAGHGKNGRRVALEGCSSARG
jgi:hypothetical protein